MFSDILLQNLPGNEKGDAEGISKFSIILNFYFKIIPTLALSKSGLRSRRYSLLSADSGQLPVSRYSNI